MGHHHDESDVDTNPSSNPHFQDILGARLSRRDALKGGLGTAASVVLGSYAALGSEAQAAAPLLNFNPVAKNLNDVVTVPEGYRVDVLYALGDPINSSTPAYANDGSDFDFQHRSGDHHDGMAYFGLNSSGQYDSTASDRGLLCVNHENISQRYLHKALPAAGVPRKAGEVDKEMRAHGVGIVEIRKNAVSGRYEVDLASALNRRITPLTPARITGPARGSDKLKTRFSPSGLACRGTINNCANGYTPWGTYLTCEENWAGYFRRDAADNANRSASELTSLSRYGLAAGAAGNYGWSTPTSTPANERYRRWNATVSGAAATDDYRNEPNTFGWVVEIDPFNPDAQPRKRTALGRFAHEGAWLGKLVAGEPVVFYLGDDGRNEYMYKFVSAAKWDPADQGRGLDAGDKYLNHGTLFAARFNADGTGEWLRLRHGFDGLDAGNALYPFADEAEVVINARLAADFRGATKMDRPEWAAVHPENGEVYLTLTNNSRRGQSGQPAVDAANPRNYTDLKAGTTTQVGNVNGHIIRWREAGGRAAAQRFSWDIFLFGAEQGADPATVNLSGLTAENDFSSPDGLWFDPRGLLWIQTDDGAYTDVTNCMMLVARPGPVGDGGPVTVGSVVTVKGANPGTANLKRFLVGPKQCEITGIDMTPDRKAIFVNIQHPGEDAGDPADPATFGSHWPAIETDPAALARPRSATIVVTRVDGGIIAE